jgi:hypothetical protein
VAILVVDSSFWDSLRLAQLHVQGSSICWDVEKCRRRQLITAGMLFIRQSVIKEIAKLL